MSTEETTNLKLHKISVHGCDDSTEVEMMLTEVQAAFLKLVAHVICDKSSYKCMPKMEIKELPHE
jgi:hypothetical protein